MSLCVAWRPWCAPLALFLPGSERPIKDAGWVGLGAVTLTLASLPAVGGLSALYDWLFVATPANVAENLDVSFNGALMAPSLGAQVSLIALLAAIGLVYARRERLGVRALTGASLAVLSFFPLVWPPHWIGLYPALLFGRAEDDAVVLGSALLMMSNPLTTWHDPFYWPASTALAIVLLSWWLIRSYRHRPERRLAH
jgi:hypothetical protein